MAPFSAKLISADVAFAIHDGMMHTVTYVGGIEKFFFW